ncbi:MAG: altronate dehydratase family protein, partial [Succinivibrionaceae bacterium]|nr:altronate dehydratase family protein [Succinivibrionaceae bacterium]
MRAIKINPEDKVAVALDGLKSGEEIEVQGERILLRDDITRGHKFALCDIKQGEDVIKYGYPIGHASCDIPRGAHVHTHNVKTNLSGKGTYEYHKAAPTALKCLDKTFMGYRRADGQVGVRNELWIIPTVFCVNQVATLLKQYADERIKDIDSIDACVVLSHPYGCSQMGEDQLTTQTVLGSLSRHPNAASVLVLSLGCENNNLSVFKKFLDESDPRLHFLITQEVEDELEAGKRLIDEMIEQARGARREPVPISELRIGLKCGGSDGLSGITANPLIGRLSDLVVGSGGVSIMTEVPEMFGAEQILMNRAKDQGLFDKTVSLINDFKGYFSSHGETVSENPSPGNKAGGITTLEDKSLGCVQKGGKAEVADVLRYGQRATVHGLNLLQGPGNDGVSCSALATAGVHVIFFSTGRGTPFGTVVPTVKISTNNDLYSRKGGHWIDFNAG